MYHSNEKKKQQQQKLNRSHYLWVLSLKKKEGKLDKITNGNGKKKQ